MAGSGINLVLSATARGGGGTLVFIAGGETGAGGLESAGIQYTMRPALTISMDNQPGMRGHIP